MGKAARAILAVFCVIVAAPCSEGLGAATGANPQETFQWRADSGAQVSLVPVLDAASAGWCMQTLTETVTATETARRIPGAWLLATEETPTGRAVPIELLENLRATIHLEMSCASSRRSTSSRPDGCRAI
jgi:hypothetical protein